MAFVTRARGNPVLHTDVNQYATYFSGTTTQEVVRVGDSASSYADSIRQADTTNGYIFRAGYGTAISPTWMLDITKTSTILRNFADRGGQWFNVKAYGAKGDGSTDDTAAIQEAIDAAKAVGGIVFFPPVGAGQSYVCGALNLTDIGTGSNWGITLMGCGWQATRLSIASGLSATNWLDCTGSLALTICHMQIGVTGAASSSAEAECAILLAAKNGSGASNAVHLGPGLRVGGRFSKATLYCYGVPSWDAEDTDFYNYYDGSARVAWFTHDNAGSAASDFVTIATGSQSTSDITFTACEIHELSKYEAGSAATAIPLTLDKATNFKMIGGNISGNNATQYVELTDNNADGNHTFENVTFYREGSTGTVSANGFKINTATNHHVRGLIINNLNIQATTGILAGVSTAQYTGLVLGPWVGSGGLTYITSFDSSGGTLVDCDLWCNSLQIQAATNTGGTRMSPGAVTASTADNSIRLGSGFLAIPTGTSSPASTGLIRLPTQTAINWRGGSSNDLQGITSTNTDRIQIGATSQVVGTILNGTTDHDFQIAGTSKTKVTSAGLKPVRIVGDGVATALATSNFALTSGWGTSPPANANAVSGTELAGRVTVVVGGSGSLSNPVLTYTYPGGAYSTAPSVMVTLIGGTGISSTALQLAVSPGTTTCTIQVFTTASASGQSFIFSIHTIG